MEDKSEKSNKKHAASEESDKSRVDDNPPRFKKRRTSEGETVTTTATATAAPPASADRDHGPVVLNRCCVLLPTSTEKGIVPPPPPPPTSKPPKQTTAMKCIFIGPCDKARTEFIQSFVNRGRRNDNGQKKLASSNSPANSSVWSMDYAKKEYSYQNPQGDAATVLLQFYNVGCKINSSEKQQQPPSSWKSLCSSFDHVVLVLAMPDGEQQELTTEVDSITHLTRTIETWKAWMDSHCAPGSSGSPTSLILTTSTTTTTAIAVDDKSNGSGVNFVGPASTSTSTHYPHAALLIRLGAALEICRQKHGFLNWYLWGGALNHSNNENNDDGNDGTDSVDGIIQSLVESTRSFAATAMMLNKSSSTAAGTDNTSSNSTRTTAKNATTINSCGESSPPGPDDTPLLPSRASGTSP
jgi:hypothetical protein